MEGSACSCQGHHPLRDINAFKMKAVATDQRIEARVASAPDIQCHPFCSSAEKCQCPGVLSDAIGLIEVTIQPAFCQLVVCGCNGVICDETPDS